MKWKFRNILALLIAIFPVNIAMISYRLNQTENFSTIDLILYPLLVGGGISVLILILNKYLLKQRFIDTFNSGKGIWYKDIFIGLLLTSIYFVFFYIERHTIYKWIPNNNSNSELIDTIRDIAHNPFLLIIWFGPVLWIGIAIFEELSRVFLLKCLWNLYENKNWYIFVIFISSLFIGCLHIYQGLAGVISIGIKSVIMCIYFYKYRRILPLIISHALYDGLQFGVFILYIY